MRSTLPFGGLAARSRHRRLLGLRRRATLAGAIVLNDCDGRLEEASLTVTAKFAVNGHSAGANRVFRSRSPDVLELRFDKPLITDREGTLNVSVKDRQGNESRIERVFRVQLPR